MAIALQDFQYTEADGSSGNVSVTVNGSTTLVVVGWMGTDTGSDKDPTAVTYDGNSIFGNLRANRNGSYGRTQVYDATSSLGTGSKTVAFSSGNANKYVFWAAVYSGTDGGNVVEADWDTGTLDHSLSEATATSGDWFLSSSITEGDSSMNSTSLSNGTSQNVHYDETHPDGKYGYIEDFSYGGSGTFSVTINGTNGKAGVSSLVQFSEAAAPSGWTGIVNGVTNPGEVDGIAVANIAKVKGVA